MHSMFARVRPIAAGRTAAFGLLIGSLLGIGPVEGSTITENHDPSWTRPGSTAAATATHTTYAEWRGFTTTAPTNSPAVYIGPAGAATAGDSSFASSGSFMAGSDIYSFGGVITPQISVPTYNIPSDLLNVFVQVEEFGAPLDPSLLTVNGVSASLLPNYSVTQTYTDGGSDFGGFGTAYRNDYAWSFTLPNDPSSLTLNFGWGATSAAFVAAVIDTQSVSSASAVVPEPGTLAMIAFGPLGLVASRKCRKSVMRLLRRSEASGT